jgi:hypothetical protein
VDACWGTARGIAVAAHGAGEHDFAGCAGIAHPIGNAAGADQIPPPIEIERVHRQRDCLLTLSPPNFENIEVAADQANPNESSERTTQDAIDGARPEIALTIPGHRSFLHRLHTDLVIIGTQASLSLEGSTRPPDATVAAPFLQERIECLNPALIAKSLASNATLAESSIDILLREIPLNSHFADAAAAEG